jgi:hypothetical protein
MKKILAIMLAAGAVVAATNAAEARDGCGRGEHRGPWGHCRVNRGGPVGPGVVVGPGGGLVIGNFYEGRGYWDGHRYWHNRRAWHHGWRYY